MFSDIFQSMAFDADIALRQQLALNGLMICVGEISYDEAVSGEEILERAEKYIAEKFKEHGIGQEEE